MPEKYIKTDFSFGAHVSVSNHEFAFENNLELFINEKKINVIKESAISYSHIIRTFLEENTDADALNIEIETEDLNLDHILALVDQLFHWKTITITDQNFYDLQIISQSFDIPLLNEALQYFEEVSIVLEEMVEKAIPEIYPKQYNSDAQTNSDSLNEREIILKNLTDKNLDIAFRRFLEMNTPNIFSHELYKACIQNPLKIELYISFLMKFNHSSHFDAFINYFQHQSNENIFFNENKKIQELIDIFLGFDQTISDKLITSEFKKLNYENHFTSFIRNDNVDGLIKQISFTHSLNGNKKLTDEVLKQKSLNLQSDFYVYPSDFEYITILNKKAITLLDYAAFFGAVKCFKFLLMNYFEITNDIFKYAICGGNFDILKICEQNNCKIDEDSLLYCMIYNHREIFKWLVETKHIHILESHYKYIFLFDNPYYFFYFLQYDINILFRDSIVSNNYYYTNFLLHFPEIDINKNLKNMQMTPLTYVVKNQNFDIIRLFLSITKNNNNFAHTSRIDINKKDGSGNNALLFACDIGNLEIVKMLLNTEGIDINIINQFSETPLHIACKKGHIEIAKLLLSMKEIKVDTMSISVSLPFIQALFILHALLKIMM